MTKPISALCITAFRVEAIVFSPQSGAEVIKPLGISILPPIAIAQAPHGRHAALSRVKWLGCASRSSGSLSISSSFGFPLRMGFRYLL